MRRLFSRWTVLFRGNIIRNLINAVLVIKDTIILAVKIPWMLLRYMLIITSWLIGIDWWRVERDIYRKVRAYFA